MRLSKTRSAILIVSIVAVTWVTPCASLALDLAIRIKDDVTVRGPMVTLRDIATFTPESDPRVDALSRIDVAAAPSPGNGLNLNRSFLNYKIGSALSGKGEDISLEIPPTITLRRTAHIIPASQLERIFKDYVRSHAAWNPDKIVFERLDVPESVALPEGKVHWEIWDKGSDRYLGNVVLTINFYVDGKQIRNIPVSGKVTLRQEVLKAARKINPGQVLSREDVTMVPEQSTSVQRDVLTDPQSAVGKKAVRSIQPGQPIAAQMIEDPPVVKKGTRVLIVARNEMISVSTSGKAAEDGRVGDEVKVMNLTSGREVYATVKGPGLVEVTF